MILSSWDDKVGHSLTFICTTPTTTPIPSKSSRTVDTSHKGPWSLLTLSPCSLILTQRALIVYLSPCSHTKGSGRISVAMLSDTHTRDSGRISVALLYDTHTRDSGRLCSLTLTQGALVASVLWHLLKGLWSPLFSDTYSRGSGRLCSLTLTQGALVASVL